MWSQQESFYVQVVAAAPRLSVSEAGNNVIVSWPDTGIYALQQNSDPATSTAWTASGYPIITNANSSNSISITPTVGSLFFRLARP